MFTMKQTCQLVDMSYEALKYYCNEGLVPNVKRDANNRRVFDERDVKWIKSLICLKNCGMSIETMKSYLALCLQGEASIPQRSDMLQKQKERLLDKIETLNVSVRYIEHKQAFYADVLAGRTEYSSNLLPKP